MEEYSFGVAEVAAIEDIDFSGIAMCGPEVLGVGHIADKVRQAFAFAFVGVVDEDEVELQAVNLEILEGAEHFLCVARFFHTVNLDKQDGEVAAYAETPEAALREGVLSQYRLSVVAEGGCLRQIFRDIVIEAHLTAFEQRHIGAHIVEYGRCGKGVFYVYGILVLFDNLQQLLTSFCIAGDNKSFC